MSTSTTGTAARQPVRQPATETRITGQMSADLDQPAATATRRFLILAELRSGSSMLGEALTLTGQAGVPLEYFNERLIRAYATRFGLDYLPPFDDYMNFLLRHRTTPNGVFTLKLHRDQMSLIGKWASNPVRLLDSFSRIIVLRRKDKVAQAVSLYKAMTSDAWKAGDGVDDQRKPAPVPFNGTEIARLLHRLFADAGGNDAVTAHAARRGVPVMHIDYESLCADFDGCWRTLHHFLGLEPAPAAPLQLTHRQQRDAHSDWLVECFMESLGNHGPRQ